MVEMASSDPDAEVEELRRGLNQLNPQRSPHRNIPFLRWQQFLADCAAFFDSDAQWALLALVLGWRPLQLLGLDRYAPFSRIDHQGLVWLLNGAVVLELDEWRCMIVPPKGTISLTYLRHPMPPNQVVLPWELGP
jgi:hypothetical protein